MRVFSVDNWSVQCFDQLDSTNIEAMRILKQGQASDRLVVTSKKQLAGKGQYGRNWVSDEGNSFSTYILKPAPLAPWSKAKNAALLGMITAVSVGESLISLGVPRMDIFYKWPNDILIGRSKVAGILPELSLSLKGFMNAVIIGAGVNLSSAPELLDRKTTSVREKYGIGIATKHYLQCYLRYLSYFLKQWIEEGFHTILMRWSRNSHTIGEKLALKIKGEETIVSFHSFSKDGCLVIRSQYGELLTIQAGEVFFPSSE